MNADHDVLGETYRKLYATYYGKDDLQKRAISAIQTVDC